MSGFSLGQSSLQTRPNLESRSPAIFLRTFVRSVLLGNGDRRWLDSPMTQQHPHATNSTRHKQCSGSQQPASPSWGRWRSPGGVLSRAPSGAPGAAGRSGDAADQQDRTARDHRYGCDCTDRADHACPAAFLNPRSRDALFLVAYKQQGKIKLRLPLHDQLTIRGNIFPVTGTDLEWFHPVTAKTRGWEYGNCSSPALASCPHHVEISGLQTRSNFGQHH